MHIHGDMAKAVRLDGDRLPWVPSPLPGVERRMLDRVGSEVARATSLVRYAPDSVFSAHTHEGGEEFLVLEGVFSDEQGDYGPGMYVRNPCGSRHTPYSKSGCSIFVKLWQMDSLDQDFVRIDTVQQPWQSRKSGIYEMPLHRFGDEIVRLERWESGVKREIHAVGGLEILVLDGVLSEAGRQFESLGWLRFPPGAEVSLETSGGVLMFVKSGHLAGDLALPSHP